MFEFGILLINLANSDALLNTAEELFSMHNKILFFSQILLIFNNKFEFDDSVYLQNLAQAVERWEIITPIEVLIELNVNHDRCGVSTIEEAINLARLAKQIEMNTGSIIFAGITGYEGHTPIMPPIEKSQETKKSHDLLAKAKSSIESAGIKVNVVSGGGSCNYMDCLDAGILTEIQAGGGALCDLLYYHKANLFVRQLL